MRSSVITAYCTIRMNRMAAFFYDLLGTLGVTLPIAVVGVGVLIAAVREFRQSRGTP